MLGGKSERASCGSCFNNFFLSLFSCRANLCKYLPVCWSRLCSALLAFLLMAPNNLSGKASTRLYNEVVSSWAWTKQKKNNKGHSNPRWITQEDFPMVAQLVNEIGCSKVLFAGCRGLGPLLQQ